MPIFSSVHDLLVHAATTQYIIPNYQRDYCWNRKNWEPLFDDLEENPDFYFLGSLILITEEDDVTKITRSVVDGQQRLTTISILLAALYDSIDKNFVDNLPRQNKNKTRYKDVENALAFWGDNGSMECPRLLVQNKNRELFRNLICAVLDDNTKNLRIDKRNLIYKCFDYFKSCLKEKTTEDQLAMLKRVMDCQVVAIIMNDSNRAFLLFEALNNRGIPLSPSDLIKNNLMSTVARANGNSDAISKKWDDLFSKIGEEASWRERFLRHFYNVFIRKKAGKCATRATLIELYKDWFTVENYEENIQKLSEAAEIYSILMRNPEQLPNSNSLGCGVVLDQLLHVEGSTSYQLLLFIISNKDKFGFSESKNSKKQEDLIPEDLIPIVKNLISFFARRNLANSPTSKKLDGIFTDIIDQINEIPLTDEKPKKVCSKVKEIIKESLSSKVGDDKTFKSYLIGSMYDNHKDMTRFLLCYYVEEKSPDKETVSNELWQKTGKNKVNWSIEHVLPEGDFSTLPVEWKTMIGNRSIQERCMHKLGNLTLTGYNSELSNLPFAEKQAMKNEKDVAIGYLNRSPLNTMVDSKTQGDADKNAINLSVTKVWNEDTINRRTEVMVEDLIAMLSFS